MINNNYLKIFKKSFKFTLPIMFLIFLVPNYSKADALDNVKDKAAIPIPDSTSVDENYYDTKTTGLFKLLSAWLALIFGGIFICGIAIGGSLYAIMPQGNQWKDNGLKMIQGAIISAVITAACGLIWGVITFFFNS